MSNSIEAPISTVYYLSVAAYQKRVASIIFASVCSNVHENRDEEVVLCSEKCSPQSSELPQLERTQRSPSIVSLIFVQSVAILY